MELNGEKRPKFENAPPEMASLAQWVLWREESGHRIFSERRETLKITQEIYESGGWDGIGFFFVKREGLSVVGIECAIGELADRVVARFPDAYIERSKNGVLHFWFLAETSCDFLQYGQMRFCASGRILPFTGEVIFRPDSLPDRTDDLNFVINAVQSSIGGQGREGAGDAPENVTSAQLASDTGIVRVSGRAENGRIALPRGLHATIEQRLEAAFAAENGAKIRQLFEGSIEGYPSASEADLALAGLLKFYSDGHPLILAVMMRRSKLCRGKWDEPIRADGGLTHLEHICDLTLAGESSFWRFPNQPPATIEDGIESRRWTFGQLAPLANEYRHFQGVRGLDSPWEGISRIWRPRKGDFSVVLAEPSAGKSTMVNAQVYHFGMVHGWRIGIVSFETQPKRLANLFAQIHLRQPTLTYNQEACEDADFLRACAELDGQFVIFDLVWNDCNVDSIIRECEEEIGSRGLDGLVIDTFTNLHPQMGYRRSQLDFINDSLSGLIRYTRRRNLHTWLIVHPTKQYGKRQKLQLYDACGTHRLRSDPDFGIVLARKEDILILEAQKVREDGICGQMGGEAGLRYDSFSNNYVDCPVPISLA